MSRDSTSPPRPAAAAEEESFACESQPEPDGVRVRARGALDLAGTPVLQQQLDALRAAGCNRLVIDLTDLYFIDSTGLRLLLKLNADAARDGYSIALVPGPPAVQRVFEVTGTRGHLPFVEG